jgi:hypothetical protein
MKSTFTRTYRVKVPSFAVRRMVPLPQQSQASWSGRVALVHKAKNAARFSTAERPLPEAFQPLRRLWPTQSRSFRDARGRHAAKPDPLVDARDRFGTGGQEDDVHTSLLRVRYQCRGDRSAETAAACRGQRRDADDLGHAVDRLVGAGGERTVLVLGDGGHGKASPNTIPAPQELGLCHGGDTGVPFPSAVAADLHSSGGETHRGHRSGRCERGIVGAEDPYRHVLRVGHRHRLVEDHERALEDGKARLPDNRKQIRCDLIDPLERLGDAELALSLP